MASREKEFIIRDAGDVHRCVTELLKLVSSEETKTVLLTIWEAFLEKRYPVLRNYRREIESLPSPLKMYALAVAQVDTNDTSLLTAIKDTYKDIVRVRY